MIETRSKPEDTPRDKRFYPVCDSNEIEDEIHFLFHCPKYSSNTKLFYKLWANPLLGPLTFVALLINLRDSFRMMTLDFY